MGFERGVAVRPAGAPMVPSERPSAEGADDRSSGAAAGAVATEARDAGREVAAEAREAGKQVAVEARDAGKQVADDARRAANEQIDRRSTLAGEKVGLAATDARDIADVLRDKGREGTARVADDAAERMDRFSEYLRDADSDRIMSDIRRIGRTQPAALVAGAAVVGILVGRVVKASEPADTTRGGPR